MTTLHPTPTAEDAGASDLLEALARTIYGMAPFPSADDPGEPMAWEDTPVWAKERNRARADVLIAGPLAAHLAAAEAKAEEMLRERDEARADRDALCAALGFKPGPLAGSRKVVLKDAAGLRPTMVAARRSAERARDDADLWTMRMLEAWPQDTLLLRLWRQRKATGTALAQAQQTAERDGAEIARLRAALEQIAEEHDAGRHDGLPEPCPAHDADVMWALARAALNHQKAPDART